MSEQEIKFVLEKLQEGYTLRDPSTVDQFMQNYFINDDSVEIIGTNAVTPGKDEWCLGFDAARQLILNDWKYWGNICFELEQARLKINGDTAWVSTSGTVSDTIEREKRYQGFMAYAEEMVNQKSTPTEQKMLNLVQLGNDLMAYIIIGDKYICPFRFSAVLIREEGQWKFHQMHFSFPTVRNPHVYWKE